MTRIIAGTAGGRKLTTPTGSTTRPTSDRVREALFSSIESWAGSLHGLRFLDLYAGSGAVGLEAWSRGAAAVTMVESHKPTSLVIRANVGALKAAGVQVVDETVTVALGRGATAAYDVVFSDPPYPLEDDAVAADLAALAAGGWLRSGALVVLERSSRSPEPRWPRGFDYPRRKKYGESVLWYVHAPLEEEQ